MNAREEEEQDTCATPLLSYTFTQVQTYEATTHHATPLRSSVILVKKLINDSQNMFDENVFSRTFVVKICGKMSPDVMGHISKNRDWPDASNHISNEQIKVKSRWART